MSPPSCLDYSGDVAIVSGAGSQLPGEYGNGRATAIMLARHGAKVVLVDNNLEWVNETHQMISDQGGTSLVVHADVADEDACRGVVEQTVKAFGAVHVLVNVVGVTGPPGDATTVDMEAWDRGMQINVKSMVLMSRYAVPEMRKAGRGAIVNFSSISGLAGGDPNLLYTTTKGAIVHMTRAMAVHHGSDNIRVNAVAIGTVHTPIVRVVKGGMSEEMRKYRIEQNLLKMEGTAWDVAWAVLYLCSKEARYITGVILPVDAGTTASGLLHRAPLSVDH